MLKIKINPISLLFFATIFLVSFLPHADTDFGWHYRCGELLLQGNPCIDNKFTYFLSDYKWAYPSFIYDAFIAITYRIGGFAALSVLGSLVYTLLVYTIYKNIKGPAYLKITLISIFLYLSWGTIYLGLRSQVVSLLFLVITISLILKNIEKINRTIWILPPLFLIWANTHAGFILGPIIISFYILYQLLSRLKKETNQKPQPKDRGLLFPCEDSHTSILGNNEHFIKFISASVLSIAATFINPFTYRIYEEVYRHFKTPMNTTIAEWVPPNILFQVIIVTLVIIYFIYTSSSKRLNIFNSLLIVTFAYLAISAKRNVPVFMLAYIMTLGIRAPRLKHTKPIQIIVLLVAFLFLGLNNLYKTIELNKPSDHCEAKFLERYPCKEAEYFMDKSGNIYNTYEWGGYLIWKIPNMKIFIDGRMPAWSTLDGIDSYTYWLKILQTQEAWDKKLNELNTNYLFIGPGTFMDLLLKDNSEKYGYQEVLRGNGVIYKRIM